MSYYCRYGADGLFWDLTEFIGAPDLATIAANGNQRDTSSFEFPSLSQDTKKVSKSSCRIALSIFLFLYVTKLVHIITNFAVFDVTNYNKIVHLHFPVKSGTLGCHIKFRRKSWQDL